MRPLDVVSCAKKSSTLDRLGIGMASAYPGFKSLGPRELEVFRLGIRVAGAESLELLGRARRLDGVVAALEGEDHGLAGES